MPSARTAWPLAALTGVFLVLGSVYAVTTPPFEKTDEEGHYGYVAHLVNRGQLPPLVLDEALNPAGLIAGHPPLYYALSAALVAALRLDTAQPLPPVNPFWAYPAPGAVPDNKNRFIHSPEVSYPADAAMRALSLILSAATIPCAYGLVRQVTQRRAWALLSAALIAVHPQFLFIASSASNDGLVTALSTAALWALVRVPAQPEEWKRWAAFGALGGLAALTKTSAILLPLLGALVAAWLGVRLRRWHSALIGVAAGAGGWLLLAGGWYARNALYFGDPLGLGLHAAPFPEGARLTLADLPTQLSIVSISFWGAFGWTNVLWPEWAYTGLSAMQVAAFSGVLSWLWVDRRRLGRYAVMLLFVALMTAAFVWWATRLQGTLGRLLFPALAPLMLLFVIGLSRWWKWLPGLGLAFVATLALLGPLAIVPAYQPPRPLAQLLESVERVEFNLGEFARLRGYRLPATAAPGEEVTLTLCWEALSRTAQPMTVFVQLVGSGSRVIANRNTYPGLGRQATTVWQPRTLFCDEVAAPIVADAPGPAEYAVHVGMFDLNTGARVPVTGAAGQPVSVIELGRVKVSGSGPRIPADGQGVNAIFAEPMVLRGYVLSPLHAGQTATLTLYWEATGTPSADYAVFVHLLDAEGNLIAQSDSPPGSDAHLGFYPTGRWEAGETIMDVHLLNLPTEVAPGAHRLRVGLYLPGTGERVPLASGADAVELGEVDVAR
jgi:hypothetical protein